MSADNATPVRRISRCKVVVIGGRFAEMAVVRAFIRSKFCVSAPVYHTQNYRRTDDGSKEYLLHRRNHDNVTSHDDSDCYEVVLNAEKSNYINYMQKYDK